MLDSGCSPMAYRGEAYDKHHLRVQPPSFSTLTELENGKSDWAEIFTIDRARKIRGHIFERFFFSGSFTPFFWQKRFSSGQGFWYEALVRLSWNFYQRWSQRFPRGVFFVSKNLSSFNFYRGNTVKFSRDLVCLHEKPYNFWLRGENWKQKKGPWRSVVTTSGENFSSIGPVLHTKTLVPISFSRQKPFFEKNGKYCFTMYLWNKRRWKLIKPVFWG